MSGERHMVERAEPRSYYGQPILKEPVWKAEIPFYFFTGGVAGASAMLGLLAEASGNDELARRAWLNAFAGIAVSPALLLADLGRPERFLNMLRMFKITSPMSVGSWILASSGASTTLAAFSAQTGLFPRAGRVAKIAAGVLGMPLSTYTAALVSNTSVPAWHEARWTLPFTFGSSAAASAGAAAAVTTRPKAAAPARRLAIGGAVAEAISAELMKQRLGELGEPYSKGRAGAFRRVGAACLASGAAVLGGRGSRSRTAAVVGGSLVMVGAVCARWSVFRAGFQSAADPKYTVGPQRARIEAGQAPGAARATPETSNIEGGSAFSTAEPRRRGDVDRSEPGADRREGRVSAG
jgi:formate-dependent nitrite reductase membrane component NrfD